MIQHSGTAAAFAAAAVLHMQIRAAGTSVLHVQYAACAGGTGARAQGWRQIDAAAVQLVACVSCAVRAADGGVAQDIRHGACVEMACLRL
jgi:hypothetical protein